MCRAASAKYASPGHREASRYSLGCSSLWLAVPCMHGVFGVHAGALGLGGALLLAVTCAACLVSTLTWRTLAHTGDLSVFKADKAVARLEFVALCVFSVAAPPPAVRPAVTACVLPITVATLYRAGMALDSRGHETASHWAHAAFRFVGFWWALLALAHPSWPSAPRVALGSTCYWAHMLYSVRWPTAYGVRFRAADWYDYGCLDTLAAVAVTFSLVEFV
ncbi:hypothetical protein EMIHUDRAFT_251228 [Emiliania huxleyi CCMP1516]|uniref:Uncharacterized protein n=2 Tax=Emiliania huxleyi TaxID=2903 RepID=A0A0D3KWW6_EMIH1|nr:hypothetical protein EMIHUDRAFT_251228 [Emiliania huxleyi CCMP1516]EOD40251.1 hypothetical protein EMIHUDRAFT_251228 [Emiliania huxleyi CCMP1516]|eukprot:XP_005792680.1 hypothetical protein EMIHUDRAFT_251228 [Emiliania huxleyi CCMP1516]